MIEKSELDALELWLTSVIVPFSGNTGKVFFHKTTKFPRYKFNTYAKENNTAVRRVKSLTNCDMLVLDIDAFLKDIARIKHYTGTIILESAAFGNNGEIHPLYREDKAGQEVYMGYAHYSVFSCAEHLTELYKTYLAKNFKVVNVFDINEAIGKNYSYIDAKKADQLDRLLGSKSPDDVKLGMEIFTNCDLESSLLHVLLLFARHGHSTMKFNPYWNSTSFKAFRMAVEDITYGLHNVMGYSTYDIMRKFLKLPDKVLFDDDVKFIENHIKEEILSNYEKTSSGFSISNLEIDLNIDPSKIIKNVVVDETVETAV